MSISNPRLRRRTVLSGQELRSGAVLVNQGHAQKGRYESHIQLEACTFIRPHGGGNIVRALLECESRKSYQNAKEAHQQMETFSIDYG